MRHWSQEGWCPRHSHRGKEPRKSRLWPNLSSRKALWKGKCSGTESQLDKNKVLVPVTKPAEGDKHAGVQWISGIQVPGYCPTEDVAWSCCAVAEISQSAVRKWLAGPGSCSLLPQPCGFWGSNLGHKAWQQVPIPVEPLPWLLDMLCKQCTFWRRNLDI